MAPEGGACVAAAAQARRPRATSPPTTRSSLFNTGTGFKYVENRKMT